MRYVHTNIIARDWKALSAFYQEVFGAKPIGPRRDLRGAWLDALTGIPGVHCEGEHLLLPGHGEKLPTLEIYSYTPAGKPVDGAVNRIGLGHLAFEVEDVPAVVEKVIAAGGSMVSEHIVEAHYSYADAVFVYVRDPEGNMIELQSWRYFEEES